jgi:hypothetical protein
MADDIFMDRFPWGVESKRRDDKSSRGLPIVTDRGDRQSLFAARDCGVPSRCGFRPFPACGFEPIGHSAQGRPAAQRHLLVLSAHQRLDQGRWAMPPAFFVSFGTRLSVHSTGTMLRTPAPRTTAASGG